MKKQQFHLYLNDDEYRKVLQWKRKGRSYQKTYGHKASVHFLMRVYACFIAISYKKILRVVSIKVFKRG